MNCGPLSDIMLVGILWVVPHAAPGVQQFGVRGELGERDKVDGLRELINDG